MSHIPPNGPPYYYPGAPPTTGGYAYVPVAAPVMMPMYAPPPHQPPPHHPPPHHPHPPHYPPPHHPPPSHYPPPQHYPPPPPTPAPEPPSQTTYVTNYIYEQPQQPGPSITVIEAPAQPLKPWQAIAGIAGSLISEVSKIGNNQQTISHVYNEVAVAESRPEPSPEPSIDWVPATTSSASSYTHRAFVGGKEGWDGSPLWIIRAHHSGELVPGKLSVKQRAAYIPHGGREIPVHNFEILCAPQNSLRWVPAGNGQVPVGAIPAGNTHNAEPLYIARCRHMRSSTPGKVHPSHTTAYISYGGSEIPYRNYEVLCKIV